MFTLLAAAFFVERRHFGFGKSDHLSEADKVHHPRPLDLLHGRPIVGDHRSVPTA
jgi:hypothetical protein